MTDREKIIACCERKKQDFIRVSEDYGKLNDTFSNQLHSRYFGMAEAMDYLVLKIRCWEEPELIAD